MNALKCLALVAMLVGFFAPLQAQELHGSIAFSQESEGRYAWGIAWLFGSPVSATAEAVRQCQREGGTKCAEVGWFRNACGALAIGDDNGYGAGWGRTTAQAERDALRQCRADNANCRIEVARCSDSIQAVGGSGRTEIKAKVKVRLEPKCVDLDESTIRSDTVPRCLAEFRNPPGCWMWEDPGSWYAARYVSGEDAMGTWSGPCANGLANGEGTLSTVKRNIDRKIVSHTEGTGTMVDGNYHGQWKFVTRGRGREYTDIKIFVHGKFQH